LKSNGLKTDPWWDWWLFISWNSVSRFQFCLCHFIFSKNALVQLFVRLLMPWSHNVVSWTAMINGCIQNGDTPLTTPFFSRMREDGVAPTSPYLGATRMWVPSRYLCCCRYDGLGVLKCVFAPVSSMGLGVESKVAILIICT
jgi:pentatricopeptide repeat protein